MGLKNKYINTCPVCKSRNLEELLSSDNFHYVRCNDCGLVFLSNVPPDEYFRKFYVYEKNINKEIKKLNPILLIYMKFPITNYLMRLWGNIVNLSRAKSIIKLKKTPKILDIGCGPGNFLFEMKKLGADTYGLELGSNLVRLAESKIGLGRVFKGYLDKINFKNTKFDIVTIWHVLEHISEVDKTLKNIVKILSTDGIVVIEVPHSKSINLTIFKKDWTLLLPPQHLHIWSYEAFEKLFNKYGLVIEKVDFPNHFPFIFFSSMIKKHKDLLFLTPLLLPLSVILCICFSVIGRGDLIRVYASRKKK